MPERARQALVLGGMATVGAVAWTMTRDLPDPVGEEVMAACEARLHRMHDDAAIEVLSRHDERTPAETAEWGPTGPAGDTLHDVAIAYARSGPDGAGGAETARCTYLEEAADAGFDPTRLRFEDLAAPS